jgi:hypothetical protein
VICLLSRADDLNAGMAMPSLAGLSQTVAAAGKKRGYVRLTRFKSRFSWPLACPW